ncbi:MAG: 2-amino-3,7-dideoxy-D-threo-hept-6-ulosonate synthase [Candidatus Bathyarchaeia archaeon]|jgi:class I fructose-bisphosphate aldolase
MESGKTRRLRRIMRTDSKSFIIAMDHGVTLGPVRGLENMQETVKRVVSGGADAVLVHKGIAKHVDTQGSGLIVHVSASTKLGGKPNLKVGVCTLEEAVRLGADAVSAHINIGSEDEDKMLEFLGSLSEQCDSYGVPLLAMMYPRGPNVKDENEYEVVSHAARIGAELGADVVKTVYTGDTNSFRRVVQSCPVPVVVAGGPRMKTDMDVLELGESSMKAGAAGLSFGRNVFQHDKPEAMSRALAAIVHEHANAKDASRLLEGS